MGQVDAIGETGISRSYATAMRCAELNPYSYHIIQNDEVLSPERVLQSEWPLKPKIEDFEEGDLRLQLVALPPDVEVQWYITVHNLPSIARANEEMLPTITIDGSASPLLGDVLKKLLDHIPRRFYRLQLLLNADVIRIPKLHKRKLDLGRQYEADRNRWVYRCVFVLDDAGISCRLKSSDFEITETLSDHLHTEFVATLNNIVI